MTTEVGEEEHDDGVARRGNNYAAAHGEICCFYRLQRRSVFNMVSFVNFVLAGNFDVIPQF